MFCNFIFILVGESKAAEARHLILSSHLFHDDVDGDGALSKTAFLLILRLPLKILFNYYFLLFLSFIHSFSVVSLMTNFFFGVCTTLIMIIMTIILFLHSKRDKRNLIKMNNDINFIAFYFPSCDEIIMR